MQRRAALHNLLSTSFGWLASRRTVQISSPSKGIDGRPGIVAEDLNLGYGTVPVPTSGGGSATGTKIGLFTFARVVNVRDLGAVGDGTVDDTAALQAAIAVAVAGGTGAVFFPPGTYRVTGTLTHTGPTLALIGVGANSSVILHDPGQSNTDAVVFASRTAAYQSDNSVQGLTIQSTNAHSRYLLDINGQADFLLEHAYVTGGVHPVRINNAIHGAIRHAKIRNGASHGILMGDTGDSVTTWLVTSCYISSNAGAGVYTSQRALTFVGTILESNGNYGLYCYSGGARVVGCHFEGNKNGCIRGGDVLPAGVYTYIESVGTAYVGGALPVCVFDYVVFSSVGDYVVTSGVFIQPTVHTKRTQVLSDPIPPSATTLTPVSVPDYGATRGFLGSVVHGYADFGATGIGPYAPNVHDGAQHFIVTGAFSISRPAGYPVTGQQLMLLFTQHARGGHAVTWHASFRHTWSDDGNVANARSAITFVFDGTLWQQVAYVPWNANAFVFPRLDVSGVQAFVSDLRVSHNGSPALYLTSTTPSTGREWSVLTLGASGVFRIDDDTAGVNELLIDPVNGVASFRLPLRVQNTVAGLYGGAGSPAGVVAAPVGSLYLNTSGGASTTLYVKESGANGNSGWVGK